MANNLKLALSSLCLALLPFACQPDAASANCPSFEEMEARQARLENRIGEALKSGKLSERQAKRYRKILSEVAARESRCRAGRHLSQFEANQLNLDLDYVSRCISHALKSKQSTSTTEPQEEKRELTEKRAATEEPSRQTPAKK
jgi:hypothetical protein